jgi:hypothetical protein
VPDICKEHAGIDRAKFHKRFNEDVVRLFQQRLPPAREI